MFRDTILLRDDADDAKIGVQFVSMKLPQYATIVSATLTLTSHDDDWDFGVASQAYSVSCAVLTATYTTMHRLHHQ